MPCFRMSWDPDDRATLRTMRQTSVQDIAISGSIRTRTIGPLCISREDPSGYAVATAGKRIPQVTGRAMPGNTKCRPHPPPLNDSGYLIPKSLEKDPLAFRCGFLMCHKNMRSPLRNAKDLLYHRLTIATQMHAIAAIWLTRSVAAKTTGSSCISPRCVRSRVRLTQKSRMTHIIHSQFGCP